MENLEQMEKLKNDSKSIQAICMYLVIATILIVLFVVSPLRNHSYLSMIGNVLCIGLLVYALYKNTLFTLENRNNPNAPGIYGYVLSLFVFVLIVSLIRKYFVKPVSSTPFAVV